MPAKDAIADQSVIDLERRTPAERPKTSVTARLEWAVTLALLLWFVVAGFRPAWQTLNTDFPNYYIAASLRMRGIPLGRAYEWIWFQREKDHLGIDQPLVGFMPNPPMCAVPMLPLSLLNPLAAKRVWLILNVGFLALSLWILRNNTSLSWRRLLMVALFCVLPLRSNFICGQYYLFILLLLCVAYHYARSGRAFTSGAVLAGAASLKLFPAVFLVLFLRKRNWRSAAGLLTGTLALGAASVAIFGWDVHRMWLIEVLPRALRGDIIDPYAIAWSSFSALWHRLFLFEPQLNPTPILNLPFAYSLAQALTATVLLFSFLWSIGPKRSTPTMAIEWATFVPLMLLLSSMPSPYHYCLLILSAIVGVDAFLKIREPRAAAVCVALFALACAPVSYELFAGWLLLTRLFATLALYLFLLNSMPGRPERALNWRSRSAPAALAALLFFSSFVSTRGRGEDFRRRVPFVSEGYSATNPAMIGSRVAFTEMRGSGYAAMTLDEFRARQAPIAGDVLSLTGSRKSELGYFEIVDRSSSIVLSAIEPSAHRIDRIATGEQPVLSLDQEWLAFTQRTGQTSTIWISPTDAASSARMILRTRENIMDIAFAPDGNLVAAAGPIGNPYLVVIQRSDGAVRPLPDVSRPARYPSFSADGKRLAFSRREAGSWQLVVRDSVTQQERQLTNAPCNATSPAWQDDNTILYATDCGRGLGLTALARATLTNR